MELSELTNSKRNNNKEIRSGSEVEQVILEFHFDEDESVTGFAKVVQIPSEVIQTCQGTSQENIDDGDGKTMTASTNSSRKVTSTKNPIHCYAPECENDSSTPGITMVPFPIVQLTRRKWATLLRLGKHAAIPSWARLCSWHFPEGVKKGPTRFQWNEAKSFALNFPTPPKKRKRLDTEPEPSLAGLPVQETDPDPIPTELESQSQPSGPDPEKNQPSDPHPEKNQPNSPHAAKTEIKPEPRKFNTPDEFRDFSRDDLVDKIRGLREQRKNLKVKLKTVEKELIESVSPKSINKGGPSSTPELSQLEVQQLQDRWTKEKKLILEANAALAFQVKKEQTARIALEERIKCTGLQVSLKQNLRYENCYETDTLKYFTGIPTKSDFDTLYKFLEPLAKSMKHWDAKPRTESLTTSTKKSSNRIDNRNQLFLTLCRYKRGYTVKDLAFLFGVDPVFIDTIFITFSKLIESELERYFSESHQIEMEREQRPEIARTLYPTLFAVLGSIEMHFDFRSVVYTQFPKTRKPCPVYKIMYLCSTSGNVIHVSSVFPGKTTDKEIVSQSNILNIVPPGSELFADQELSVAEECIAKEIQLRIFSIDPNHVLVENDAWETKLLTTCRMKVIKLVGLMKYFKIFDHDFIASNTQLIIRTALLLENYIDTTCSSRDDVEAKFEVPSA